jgi:hypothetical protein
MKSRIAIFAALLAAALAMPSQARAPDRPAGWLLIAQGKLATCELDGRKVPQGMTLCLDGYVHTCNRSGRWEKSAKAC